MIKLSICFNVLTEPEPLFVLESPPWEGELPSSELAEALSYDSSGPDDGESMSQPLGAELDDEDEDELPESSSDRKRSRRSRAFHHMCQVHSLRKSCV
jgi:hypothetical protein